MAINVLEKSPINLDFLRKVIPSEGVLMITQIENGKAINSPCDGFDAMEKKLRRTDKSGVDVYHACASFEDGTSRAACNAKFHKALFLDLDCGEEKAERKQGYVTQRDALNALKAFCKSVGLPPPIIVDSGGGIHVYWAFEMAVPTANWKAAAEGLKSLCRSYGLLADRQVTADAARILRPVGSHNRKYDQPRRVRLLKDADCVDFVNIKAIIDAAASRFETVDASINDRGTRWSAATEVPASLAEQVNPNRYNLSQVEEALRRIDPECPRCEWLPVGMAIADAFGEIGRDLFLKWSRGDLREQKNGAE